MIVVGNDDDATEDCRYLQRIARTVYLAPGTASPKFSNETLERVMDYGNLRFMKGFELTEIIGTTRVEKAKLRSEKEGSIELEVSAMFFSGEKTPVPTSLEKSGIETDPGGYVPTNRRFETNVPGVYAIGDMTCEKKYQISISAGQAAAAALNIIRELR